MPACGPFSCWGAGADFLVRWAQKFDSAERLGERRAGATSGNSSGRG